MTKLNCVNLDAFMEKFAQLERKITEVNGKNNMLEVMLEDANRLMKFYLTKEKSLIEERDSLLVTVNKLQQTLQEQCNLREYLSLYIDKDGHWKYIDGKRETNTYAVVVFNNKNIIVENEKLKNDVADLKQQNERSAEDGEAEVQQLVSEMRAEREKHKRELETVRQQCRSEVEEVHRQSFNQLEANDAEVKKLLENKDVDLEEMKKRLKEQERERQSELLKLQMEFGAKLARVQSTAQWSQQQQQQHQQHGSNLLPQSVFKRKLQSFQEEKNKEIVALRQRIKELEENQRACGLNDMRLKRKKI